MTKKELVAKIAKEQNLDPKKLERMNMETLHKMDKVVPDTDGDLLGSAELPSANVPHDADTIPATGTDGAEVGSETTVSTGATPDVGHASDEGTVIVGEMTGTMELPPQETPAGSTEVASEEGSDVHGTRTDAVVGHVILGYHPVTEEPVYADEQ